MPKTPTNTTPTSSSAGRKITASMFASNFIVQDDAWTFLQGEDKLKKFSQSETISTGNTMTNYFCSDCGVLMYRVSSGFPGMKIPRIGTVDDFRLHETKLKPKVEQFTKDRVAWLPGAQGVTQVEGNHYSGGKEWWPQAKNSGVGTKMQK
ncbi:histidine acid [Teratosphaeria destructans]|uniref:Histidine acid n=1 Tax=Teratosphaeria destructans TaxID=418781 RepID=A0A9W7T281_9PEZI|nr:histidine acid [Teratosphaeria destructans]